VCNKNKGFSLIELMIVISIIGILAAVAVPSYQQYVYKAKTVEMLSGMNAAQTAVAEYIQSTGSTDCTNMTPQLYSYLPADNVITWVHIDYTGLLHAIGPCTVVAHSDSFPGGYFEIYARAYMNSDGSINWVFYTSNPAYSTFPLLCSNGTC